MAKAGQKIMLRASRNIPYIKLVLSQSAAWRLKFGVSIEDLAEDIARRALRYAESLGVDVKRAMLLILVCTGWLCGIVTAHCGPVASSA